MVQYIDPMKLYKYKFCMMCARYSLRSKWDKNHGSCPLCGSEN